MTPSYNRNIIHKWVSDQEREVREVETQPFSADDSVGTRHSDHHAIHIHRNGVTDNPDVGAEGLEDPDEEALIEIGRAHV